ncbi:MAG TPA: 2Fe-2S iron-sulfur cluster binding domain-containing protein [Candidatus Mediterraneibacter intestinipullorum]|nr:2Fe-2S iron-sulfur cluster binding domain-containing protein [Candidatus Mediterraneibacter intestinipullorum]
MDDYRITDEATGETFFCRPDESLLAAMRRTGKGPIKMGCFGGGCGVCKVRISDGRYQTFKKMSRAHISPEEEEQSIVLACCVKPLSNITLIKA